MKQTKTILTVAIFVSIFTVCFLIGRATVLKESDEQKKENYYEEGGSKIPKKSIMTETSNRISGIAKSETAQEKSDDSISIGEEPPLQMSFPCGKDVLKPYSQSAVYSKTTDDWRAHLGIDYRAGIGDKVHSICDGVVTKIYKDKIWGYCIEILHTGQVLSIYRNLAESVSVKENQTGKEGQVIAEVGSSASVEKLEEPHLHLEIWLNSQPINPESFVY